MTRRIYILSARVSKMVDVRFYGEWVKFLRLSLLALESKGRKEFFEQGGISPSLKVKIKTIKEIIIYIENGIDKKEHREV